MVKCTTKYTPLAKHPVDSIYISFTYAYHIISFKDEIDY